MAREPGERQASAAEFGRELQLAQRHNGLTADPMALNEPGGELEPTGSTQALRSLGNFAPDGVGPVRPRRHPVPRCRYPAPGVRSRSRGVESVVSPVIPNVRPPRGSEHVRAHHAGQPGNVPGSKSRRGRPFRRSPHAESAPEPQLADKRNRKRLLITIGAAVAVVLLVIASVVIFTSRGTKIAGAGPAGPRQPAVEMQPEWEPIADARVARDAVAATDADGTIWVFGGLGRTTASVAATRASTPPSTVGRAARNYRFPCSVRWPSLGRTPRWFSAAGAPTARIAKWRRTGYGGWSTAAGWSCRHCCSRGRPRRPPSSATSSSSPAVSTANGKLLNTTEIYDGTAWRPAPPSRRHGRWLGAASDGKLVYTVGGTNGTSDLTAVEAYDPVADTWTTMPASSGARAVTSASRSPTPGWWRSGACRRGRFSSSVDALDLTTATWTALPDLAHRAARLRGRGSRQDRVRHRRVDRCRRRPGHGVGRSAEARTAQAAACGRMAVAAGCADREADDGLDGARRTRSTSPAACWGTPSRSTPSKASTPRPESGNRFRRCPFRCITRRRRPSAARWSSSVVPPNRRRGVEQGLRVPQREVGGTAEPPICAGCAGGGGRR